MTKQLISAITLLAGMSIISLAQADGFNCQAVSYSYTSDSSNRVIVPVDNTTCATIQKSLADSNRYPDIFSATPARLLPLCFASYGTIPAQLGKKAVKVNTISAWTTEFAPAPYFGTETVAGVITQWTVTDAKTNNLIGKIYTHDTVDLVSSSELDVIVGSGGPFLPSGAKGAIRIDSENTATGILIKDVTGEICLPN